MIDKPTVLRCGFLFKKLFPAQVKDTHLTVKQVQAFGSLQKYPLDIFEEKTCITYAHLTFSCRKKFPMLR